MCIRDRNEARRPHTCSRPCAFEERKTKKGTKSRAPKTHHEIYISAATASTSRRRAIKHVPRVSPYSPASINSGFVEIGLVQLSQSVKTMNVTHTQTDGQREQLNNGTLHAPRYEEAFSPICKKWSHCERALMHDRRKRPRSLRSTSLASFLLER